MKKIIEPVKVWVNGQEKDATILSIDRVQVNLKDTAECRYSLLDENLNVLVSRARASLTQAQYDNWGLDDSYFINTIASNLNLTITGDYVAPEVPEELIPEPQEEVEQDGEANDDN